VAMDVNCPAEAEAVGSNSATHAISKNRQSPGFLSDKPLTIV
jgi:hypothetical protein